VLHGGCGLSNEPLPPPSQIRVGGRYTVRGYRENFLVRDNGCFAGADYQIPLVSDAKNLNWNVWIVSFIDAGVAWNHEESITETIAAAGIGIRANYSDWFRSEFYFGVPLRNQVNDRDDIQDQGIHFRISAGKF
jgi:hemolysin activation/secretion protein